MLKKIYIGLIVSCISARDPFHDPQIKSATQNTMTVSGIIFYQNTAAALVKNERDVYKQVAEGDEFDQWLVYHIYHDRVEFKHRFDNRQLILEIAH